ncbi:MAG: TetR/AcrR family transcriptional regulator [Chloroflexi bacterium]|nr:TetR/AcrR family transcriptional regulator [Chloroflexota bacterium]
MKDPVQEQLVATRRKQILDAAARVFAEKGFHPATIKDIAREAGIADGTIYNYFENKTALLLGIFDLMREAALRDFEPAALAEDDVRGFLTAYLRQPLMGMQGDNLELFRIIISEMMVNKEIRDMYAQRILEPTLAMAEPLFERWVAQGRIRPVDVPLLLRAISGMVMGLLMEQALGDAPLASRWEGLPDILADLILNGIGADS